MIRVLEPVHRADTIASHVADIRQSIEFMRQQLEEQLTLRALADVALMSPFHFCRVFQQVTGISPCRFLWALRLERAKSLLATQSLKVIDVCYLVGYNSLGTFTRRFSELVGCSPRRFRQISSTIPFSSAWRLRNSPRFEQDEVTTSMFEGRAVLPHGFQGTVLIGLFPDQVPTCRPIQSVVAEADGSFRFPRNRVSGGVLLAVAIKDSNDPLDYWLSERVYRARSPVPVENARSTMNEIHLHPPDLVDPPLLPVLTSWFGP